MRLQCALTAVVIDPAKTALLVIDLQNYDLSKALGNDNQAVFDAEDTVLNYAIPAARKSGIQILYITTGYSDQDLLEMDPAVFRTFNFEPVVDSPNWAELPPGEGFSNKGQYRNQKGIGDPIGEIELEDGTKIDAGRILVRGTWNSWLHDPLAAAYEESRQSMELPDIHFYKNRSSGMCERMTALTDYLNEKNLRTLLFTGINIDQCAMGTLQDAYLKGFDTILLKDGCATNSPIYAQMSCEFNCAISWGFLSSCNDFADAVSKL